MGAKTSLYVAETQLFNETQFDFGYDPSMEVRAGG